MDMTRISVCSYPFRDLDWSEALPRLQQAGFAQVDLLGRPPHLSLDRAICDPTAIKGLADSLGLHLANLGTYVGKGFASPEVEVQRAEMILLRRTVDIAALYGARSIRVSPGDDDPTHMDRIVTWFRQAADYASSQNVHLAFETHGGAISGDPKRCAELSDRVGSPYFGVLYDPCNLMHGGVDHRLALWTMREHIAHVHLKDGAVGAEGFHLTMLGAGQVDLRWIIEMLDRIGYDGDLALEYELSSPSPEEGLPRWLDAVVAL